VFLTCIGLKDLSKISKENEMENFSKNTFVRSGKENVLCG
jgi:hypothetical protein